MCELIDKNTNPIGGYTAENDIVCYKILTVNDDAGGFPQSLLFCQMWKTGTLYSTDLVCGRDLPVYESIQYYKIWDKWIRKTVYHPHAAGSRILSTYSLTDFAVTKSGFYSYSGYMNGRMREDVRYYGKEIYKKSKLGSLNLMSIGRFTIPKGGKYYVNDDASVYVSDRLRLDGTVKTYTIDDLKQFSL
jgi:hypothetical protein